MITIDIVKSINDVNKDQWDALSDDNIFASYGWLKTVEKTFIEDIKPKYILLKDSTRLIGSTVCYNFNKASHVAVNMDHLLFGRLKKYISTIGISFMPALICCPMKCCGKHVLIEKGADEKKREIIFCKLLETIETEALRKKLSVSFPNVMYNESEVIQLLKKKGYKQILTLPLNYMDIEWSPFEEYKKYINHVSKNMKKNISRQINRNRREGVTIEQLKIIDEYEDRIYELLNKNYYKYNRSLFPFKKEFFRELKKNLEDNALIYISRKKDKITGVDIRFIKNKIKHLRFIGIDHEISGDDFTYFNIGYYDPIMNAISEDIKRIYFGFAMYKLKSDRGCRTKNTYIYYKSFNKTRNLFIKLLLDFYSLWVRKNYHKW